jgi:hypothetical protein
MNITANQLEEYKEYKLRLDELLKKEPNKPLTTSTGLRLPEALEVMKLSFLFTEMYDRLEHYYAKYYRILNKGIFVKKDIPNANNIFEGINSNTLEILCTLPLNQKLKVADKMKINSVMFVAWSHYDEYFDRLFGIMKLFIDYNKNPRKYVDKFVGFEKEILSTDILQFCISDLNNSYDKTISYYNITKVINSKKVKGTICIYKDFEVYKTEVSNINDAMKEKIEQVYPELFI